MAAIASFVVGATAAVSVSLGALAHDNLGHSIAVGYYLVGSGALLGTLAFGLRGPTRREFSDGDRPLGLGQFLSFGTRGKIRRRTTDEERSDARRSSLLFFAFAILLFVIGAAVDPARSVV